MLIASQVNTVPANHVVFKFAGVLLLLFGPDYAPLALLLPVPELADVDVIVSGFKAEAVVGVERPLPEVEGAVVVDVQPQVCKKALGKFPLVNVETPIEILLLRFKIGLEMWEFILGRFFVFVLQCLN